MSRGTYTGPTLPKALLEQVHDGRVSKKYHGSRNHHDRRKPDRQQRVSSRPKYRSNTRKAIHRTDEEESRLDSDEAQDDVQSKIASQILKAKSMKASKTQKKAKTSHVGSDEDDGEVSPVVSKATKARLEEDDAEIAALEKKLGMRKKKSKALQDDGLDWLIDDSEDVSDDEGWSGKRKRPEDEKWLRDKRRKAQDVLKSQISDEGDSSDEEEEDDDNDNDNDNELQNPFSDDEMSGAEFEGFESDESEAAELSAPKKERENPYVAPVSKGTPTTKYIPPSLRNKSAPSDEEALKQLRRQLQGLLNRLSEANVLSIVQAIEQVYTQNARQLVTSAILDLLIGLVSDPSILNDTFLVLHAAFAAALYKVIGTDFGAQLLEGLVQAFDRLRADENTEGKQSLNLIAFIANLYSLQVIGSEVVFDYVRLLLSDISEANTELLLRVIRISGSQLRQDDPTSLKDIVLLLQRSVAKVGESSLSVRTKFMIETIQDLKNNRLKTGASASQNAAEQMQRMKKVLGSLSNRSKVTEPLRITLTDIRDSEKKGKWWLIGASYKDPAKMADGKNSRHEARRHASDDESDASDDVDLNKLARAQGMNTDVRRAIFVSIAGAVDHKHAHMRLMKLNLKNKQLIEIPRVLTHCVGAEASYNPYYTVIAREFCGVHKLRKAYQFVLLDFFRRMAEQNGVDEEDEIPSSEKDMSVRKIYNVAKMYATLISDGLLRITILKTLDLSDLESKAKVFVEVLLLTIMVLLRKKSREMFQESVKDVFRATHAVPDMVTGLRYYLSTILANTEIASSKKEKKVVVSGCEYANEALLEEPSSAFKHDDDSSEYGSDAY